MRARLAKEKQGRGKELEISGRQTSQLFRSLLSSRERLIGKNGDIFEGGYSIIGEIQGTFFLGEGVARGVPFSIAESRVSRNSSAHYHSLRVGGGGSHFSVFTATFRGNVASSSYTRRSRRRSHSLSLSREKARESIPPPNHDCSLRVEKSLCETITV